MKLPLIQEISQTDDLDENEHKNPPDDSPLANNQQQLSSTEEYPKNIENYFVLLKALYENSSLLNRIKDIQEQSCETKHESFKENIVSNQAINNPQVSRKNININIKNELEKDSAGGERNLGNIIINSLDVSINVAGKTNFDGDYGNINKVRISCTTSPSKKVSQLSAEQDNQQLVTSSSESIDCVNNDALSSSTIKRENNNLGLEKINDGPTRAVCSSREVESVPDDIAFDYQHIKCHGNDDGEHTTSTTCNNNSTKHPSGEDDAEDYHTKNVASIDTVKCNRHNNSTGDIRPITSTYLLMTRSMGLTDDEALNLVSWRTNYLWGFYAQFELTGFYVGLMEGCDLVNEVLDCLFDDFEVFY
jgi:hypothetical protein